MTEETTINPDTTTEGSQPQAWDDYRLLLTETDANMDNIEQVRDLLIGNREALQSALLFYRRWYREQVERNDRAVEFRQRLHEQLDSVKKMAEVERQALSVSLSALESSERWGFERDEVKALLRLAFIAGIRGGRASEAHRLAQELNHKQDGVLDIWDTVSRDQRTADGSYPQTVTFQEAVQIAWSQERYSLRVHPSDPRLTDVWEVLNHTAKREAGFCRDWNTLIEILGAPVPENPTYSGSVTVSGYFNVSVPVSGVDLDEGVDVDWTDIREHIDWSYDIEINEIYTDDLEED